MRPGFGQRSAGFLLPLCLLMAACPPGNPATGDTIEVVRTLEEGRSSGGGLHFRRLLYRQGKFEGEIWTARLDPQKVELSVAIPPGDPNQPVDLARLVGDRAEQPHVAINGGFFDRGPMGLVVSDGRVIRNFRRGGGSGVFLLREAGPAIVHRSGFSHDPGIKQGLQSIDRLVADGEILVKRRPDLPRDARSALGIDRQGRVVLVAIYDRRCVAKAEGGTVQLGSLSTELGPTLYELARLLARPEDEGGFGLTDALNLDGGFSTAMSVRLGGIDRQLLGFGPTINAILVRPPPKAEE